MAKYCLHLWEFMIVRKIGSKTLCRMMWSFHQIKVVTFALSFNEKLFYTI